MKAAAADLFARTGPRRSIAWIGGIFLAAIAAQAGYEIVRSYHAMVQATEREVDAQARVIAEQTARGIQAIDVVLMNLVDQLQTGALAHADADTLHRALRRHAQGLVQADGIVVIGPDGRVRAASQVPNDRLPPLDFSTDPPFVEQRDNPAANLRIFNAKLNPGYKDARWQFPIGRRLVDADGSFAGVVGAPGRVDYFQQFYRETYSDQSTRIALVHRDGWLLARQPPAPRALGQRVPGLEALLPDSSAPTPITVSRIPSPIDGIDHFVALRLVPDYPLAVAVSREAAAALAPWRSQALATTLRTLTLGLIAALLLAVVLSQIERLNAARARYALAAAGSDDGIWDWDLVEGTAYESRRARELQGMPLEPETETLAALKGALRVHPDDAARREAAMQAHLEGRSPAYEIEYRVCIPAPAGAPGERPGGGPDGVVRWIGVRALCVRDENGKPLRIAGSVSDIDARKRAEAALRESEQRYALAMSGSNEGHWLWDLEQHTVFVSERLAEIFGLPGGAQTLGDDDYFARLPLHPDDRELVQRNREEHLAGLTPRLDHEFRILRRNGEVAWIHTRAQRFLDAAGKAIGMAGATVDVTQRKHAEAAREKLELQLRQAQKLEAIGTLAGGIAHDFNNILSAILGYGELAQKGAAEGSAQRRHLDAAMSASQRAKSLVERILAFSRTGTGERVPVHVQAVLDEALDAIAGSLPAGVRLERSIELGDAGLLGDPTQLHQVVMNLGANAVQAMKRGGVLEVHAQAVALDAPLPLATSTLPPGRYVRLEVRDSGSGIAPEVIERIFDPFFTTKEIGVGTGLGLSLVHGIVTDLGGGIAVTSVPGRGSTFTVWLPSQPYRAAPAQAEEGPVRRGDGEAVLVVDDEEALVRLNEEMLAELGYEPVGYVSSEEALSAFRAAPERFDAVLTDESMPGLTGSQLAVEIRRLRPGMPIILMSGFVNPAFAKQARELGVDEVLAKPLASRDIARCLAALLDRQRAAEPAP